MNYKEDIKEISEILDKLIDILESEGEDQWIKGLKSFRNDCEFIEDEQEGDRIRRKILRIYGGMGSFNDFGLGSFDEAGFFVEHERGKEFDQLSDKLFDTALNQIEKK